MAFLAVRKVTYSGTEYFFESPQLGDGVNILVGENGTGKSTFANLIYFGLGGRVDSFTAGSTNKHCEITGDRNNFIELLITIDDQAYNLKRFIGTNEIGVVDGDSIEILPLTRGEGRPYVFSDWILAKLGIEPVLLQYGSHSGKLNISDLMRLIYHDQSPDPSGIYKGVDVNSYVTDSRIFRKAIFEIMIGKSFQEYYSVLAQFRGAERERDAASKTLGLFKEMSHHLSKQEPELNVVFIDKRMNELEEQQRRLLSHRRCLVKNPAPTRVTVDFAQLQRELFSVQLQLAGNSRSEAALLEELSKLTELKSELIVEATQIKKMMFANDELKLFTSNTCPYCLHEVERIPNRCVCGRNVDEKDYEKFFYSSEEYLAILKSRQKNVETVESAITSAGKELDGVRGEKKTAQLEEKRLETRIRQAVDDADLVVDLREYEDVATALETVREEMLRLRQERELVARRAELERENDSAAARANALRAKLNQLEAAADEDIQRKRNEFAGKYNELMCSTVPDCHFATIDGDYMPVVNTGEYREASSSVAKRLLYYATMLYMSLADDDVKFPRFLLIDTPETAGIDPQNLKDSIGKVMSVVSDYDEAKPCQVILTSGFDRIPAEYESCVFAHLRRLEGGRLLQRRPSLPVPFAVGNG